MRRAIVRYGPGRSQIAELWHPGTPGPMPVAVLLHGGYWRPRYTKRLMRGLAADLADRHVAVLNVEYRRTGRWGGGGGWPGTLEDVAAAMDLLARLPGPDVSRVVTCGHSAGGQLALWAAGRHRLPDGAPGAGPAVRPCGAVSLAGVVDLDAGARQGLGAGAVEVYLGGGPDRVPDRYALASPAALLPLGVPQVLVHGTADTVVPPSMSARYTEAAAAAGDPVRLLPIEGADHMAVIRPRSPAWAAARGALLELLGM